MMKHMINLLTVVLLIGCTSSKSLNGDYDVDIEYKARSLASAMKDYLDIPESEEEEFDSMILRWLQQNQYNVKIDYPYLTLTTIKPEEPLMVDVYKMQKIGRNRYNLVNEDGRNKRGIDYEYDPHKHTLTSVVIRYIKRDNQALEPTSLNAGR
jgi:hypothetical protein